MSTELDDLASKVFVLTGKQRKNKSDKVSVLRGANEALRGLARGIRALQAVANGLPDSETLSRQEQLMLQAVLNKEV